MPDDRFGVYYAKSLNRHSVEGMLNGYFSLFSGWHPFLPRMVIPFLESGWEQPPLDLVSYLYWIVNLGNATSSFCLTVNTGWFSLPWTWRWAEAYLLVHELHWDNRDMLFLLKVDRVVACRGINVAFSVVMGFIIGIGIFLICIILKVKLN